MVLALDGNAVKDARVWRVFGYLVGLMHFVISKPVTEYRFRFGKDVRVKSPVRIRGLFDVFS